MNHRFGLTGLSIALLVVAVISGLAWFTLGLIRDQTRRDLGHMLSTTLNTTREELHMWADERKDEATAWANEPDLVRWTKALLRLPHERQALLASPALASLRARMTPMITTEGFLGLFIIAPDHTNLASMRDANVGLKNLLAGRQNILNDVFSGQTRISLPFASDVPLRDGFGLMREHYPTMFVVTPLTDENGAIIAALALRIDPAKNFTRIAQLGRVGETGETYLFDNSGRLITESRFDNKLRQAGLLAPDGHAILNIEIRDPGADLAADFRLKTPAGGQSLTLMAQSAIAGHAGQNLDGYRNYRGLSVIGVWRWDESMDYGLATEIEVNEAYASLRSTRHLVFALLAATLWLSLGLSALTILMQRRSAQRLRESQTRFSDIVNSAPDAVISIDEAQCIILFNRGAESAFGYSRDEMLGQPLNMIIPPQFHNSHQKLAQEFSESDESARYMQHRDEITCLNKSGEMFPAEASISKMQASGKLIMTVILRDISERKQTEAALKESERRFRAVFETIQDIYYRTDMAGRVTNISPSCLQLTGYSQQELIGTDIASYYADPDQRNALLKALQKNGAVNDFEIEMVRKDGVHRTASVTSHIVCDQQNQTVAVEGIVRDITERIQARNELAEKSSYLDSILRSATEYAIATTDLDFRISYYNPMAEKMFGHTAEEVIGKTVQEIHTKNKVAPERFAQAIKNVRKLGEHCYAIEKETEQGMHYIDMRISGIFNADDELCGYALFSHDVTDRKLAENRLQQSLLDTKQAEAAALNMMEDAHAARNKAEQAESRQQKYYDEMRRLAEASQKITGLQHVSQIYQVVCDASLDVFDLKLVWLGLVEQGSFDIQSVAASGISSDYASSMTVRWDDSPQGCGPSGRAVKTGAPQVEEDIEHDPSFQAWKKRASQQGFHGMLAVPLTCAMKRVTGVLAMYSHEADFFTDNRVNMIWTFANQVATAIENARLVQGLEARVKKRTRQLEVARDQAQASNRAKSTFLANMSHELRTPLNSILGFSELLSLDKSHPLHPDQVSQLGFVLESGNRLLNLINDLLDLSKIEAGKMELDTELFDIRELLNHAIKHHAHALEQQGLTVHCDFGDDVALCNGDMQKIHQVLDNLLANAIKFTPAGGAVSVQARRVRAEALGVRGEGLDVSGKEQASLAFLKISVADSGIGIAAADQDKLFQPFQQLDGELNRKYEGTGLGLSLCRKIIGMHGGDIWLEHSEPGQGSTFTFVIPAGEVEK